MNGYLSDDKQYPECTATCTACGACVKPGDLFFFLFGRGLICGKCLCTEFRLDTPLPAAELPVEQSAASTIRESVDRLRAIPGAWKERKDPLADLQAIHEGRLHDVAPDPRPIHREEPQTAYLPPMQDKRFHFETEQVMEALVGTDYLRGEVHRHLHHMTSGERWSLYRAIVKLATPPSIDTREPAEPVPAPGESALGSRASEMLRYLATSPAQVLAEIIDRLHIECGDDGQWIAPAEPQPIEDYSFAALVERIANLRDITVVPPVPEARGEKPPCLTCSYRGFDACAKDEHCINAPSPPPEPAELPGKELPPFPNDDELVRIAFEVFPDDPGFLRTVWKDGIDIQAPTVQYCELSLRLTKAVRDRLAAALQKIDIIIADELATIHAKLDAENLILQLRTLLAERDRVIGEAKELLTSMYHEMGHLMITHEWQEQRRKWLTGGTA